MPSIEFVRLQHRHTFIYIYKCNKAVKKLYFKFLKITKKKFRTNASRLLRINATEESVKVVSIFW